MLVDNSASKSMHDLMSLGLFDILAPELTDGVGVEQGDYHSKDVWGHTLDVVEVAATAEYDDHHQRLLVVLAALFHDIGKPRTRSIDAEGRVRFFRHEEVGAQMTREILTRLRFPKRLCRAVAKLVGNHMRLGSAPKFSKPAVRRLLRDMGRLTDPLLKLCEADAAAIGRISKPIPFDDIRRQLQEVMTTTETAPLGSPLNGREIMQELGIEPGPEVARWKQLLTEAVLDGNVPQGDRDAALIFLRKSAKQP
jgi:poly(A) polymerase